MAAPRRYGAAVAAVYDEVSSERWVYRRPRLAAVSALHLRPGQQVLVLGCGTGLGLDALVAAVGERGRVVGVDASAAMLARARARVDRHGWATVDLVHADLEATDLRPLGDRFDRGAADAVLAAYVLSLVPGWRRVVEQVPAVVAPGARLAVVDLALTDPHRRLGRLLTPLAALACAAGGSDPCAHPWTAVEELCTQVEAATFALGHVHLRAGTLPAAPRGPGQQGPGGG